jgi:hypothetical protein
MRVARLNRHSNCGVSEQFECWPTSVEVCIELCNTLNMQHYTNANHYYAVVNDQHVLKNQPTQQQVLDREFEQLIDYIAG